MTDLQITPQHSPAGSRAAPFLPVNVHFISRRTTVALSLLTGDIAAAEISLFLSLFFPTTFEIVPVTIWFSYPALAIAALVLGIIYCFFGLYSCRGPSPLERFRLRSLGVLVHVMFMIALLSASEGQPAALFVAPLLAVLTIILGHAFERLVRAWLTRRGLWGAPTLIVGSSEFGHRLASTLTDQPEIGLRPVAFLRDNENKSHGSSIKLPPLEPAPERRKISPPIEVVLVPASCSPASYRALQRIFPSVLLVQDATNRQSLWLQSRTLGNSVGFELKQDHFLPRILFAKRMMDLLIALPLALFALPLLIILAGMIIALDGGPAFFAQTRVGRNGRPVRVLKLRTMYRDAERRLEEYLAQDRKAKAEWERYFKLSNDPRILPVIGKFLRRSSLDELPQLWNILRGEMSLVGPRPFPAYHLKSFDEEFAALRAAVPPGLTGLWQVSARSNGDLSVQKAQDLFYIRNWSIWLDLYIILETLPAVIAARGAR